MTAIPEYLAALVNAPWFPILTAVLALWSIPWKGYSLWIASKNTHRWWFVVLLLVNSIGILEIIYIFGFGRPALKKSGMLKSSAASPVA